MMIIGFFKTILKTMIWTQVSFIILAVLYSDLLRDLFFVTIIDILLRGLIVTGAFVTIYLPLYFYKKNEFIDKDVNEVYFKYLWVIILIFALIIATPFGIYLLEARDPSPRIIVINIFLSICLSFYVFIKSIKKTI